MEKVRSKVGYINLCCLKGHRVLVVGPPDYDKPCEEDLFAIQGSPSKRVQAIEDREQARLWRQQQACIADQELRNRFNQVTVVAPPGYLKHLPSPPSNRRQIMSREIPSERTREAVSKIDALDTRSPLTGYAKKLVQSIFTQQSKASVEKWIRSMIEMAEAMSIATYIMNRAMGQAHRNSDYHSKALGLSFELDRQSKIVIAIANDAPMVLRRMKLERGLVEAGRIEPVGGSATILQEVPQPPSLYRSASDDSTETFIYEPGDAPILDRANSIDSTITLFHSLGPEDMPQ